MRDGYEHLEHKHRAAEAVHRRFVDDPDDAVGREYCLLVDRFVLLEEAALIPLLRDVPGGDEIAGRLEASSASVKHLAARVFESPPTDLAELVHAVAAESDGHVREVEERALPLLRDHGVDPAALGRALEPVEEDLPIEHAHRVEQR